jgi:predicted RNA binding protein YcfA (HicA-like mRNA interferase family)
MPKLPRVSGAQAQRALERLGFIKLRQKAAAMS